ncbi:hypothetical protein GJAV_G00255670 [Gymnothorax javanicus]|nr:hypothetical protein GJAV_G00255670 [Gymnothorax javanicus]
MSRHEGTWRLVPRPRGRLPAYFAGTLGAVVLLLVYLILGHDKFCRQVVISGLGIALGTGLQGVCQLAEEFLHHLATRYNGRLSRMLRACFPGTFAFLPVVVGLLLWAGSLQLNGDEWLEVALTSGFSLLLKASGILDPTPSEISELCEQRKMNVAHGLAWSIYAGYLRIVLPHLESSIEQYRQKKGNCGILMRRDYQKLHILIPLSAFIPDKLEESDQRVTFHDNLPELTIDRAGVRRRVYKHSVYRVEDQFGQAHHIVAEYPAQMQILYQMSKDSSGGLSADDRRQQVLLFIRTLQDLLENSVECRNRYRFIILDDDSKQNAEAGPHQLSEAILKQLRQAEREEYSVAPLRDAEPIKAHYLSREPTLMMSEDLPSPLRDPVETNDCCPAYQWK